MFLIESIVLCVFFTLTVPLYGLRDPLAMIDSYPGNHTAVTSLSTPNIISPTATDAIETILITEVSKGQTTIIAENDIDEDALRSAIGATGYEVRAVSTEPYEKKGLFHR